MPRVTLLAPFQINYMFIGSYLKQIISQLHVKRYIQYLHNIIKFYIIIYYYSYNIMLKKSI